MPEGPTDPELTAEGATYVHTEEELARLTAEHLRNAQPLVEVCQCGESPCTYAESNYWFCRGSTRRSQRPRGRTPV